VRFEVAMVAVVVQVVEVWRLGQWVARRVWVSWLLTADTEMNRGWLKHDNRPGDPSTASPGRSYLRGVGVGGQVPGTAWMVLALNSGRWV
jgi:hypothetical protein